MSAARTPAIRIRREPARATLAAAHGHGLVRIDLARRTIVSADELGALAVGLPPGTAFPFALDVGTPALAQLRELAALGSAGGQSVENVTFGSRDCPRPVRCIVSLQGDDQPGVFVLRTLNEAAALPAAPDPGGALHPEQPDLRPGGSPGAPDQARAFPDSADLAKLVHELKTPLTAIAAAAEIMRDERLGAMGNARYLGYAADIRENAMHALDVIAALLSDNAKPGAALPHPVALDLNAIVERTVSSIQALAHARQLTLTFKPDENRPHVIANPTSLRQILLNLLTNAIKFTPPGGSVDVETGARSGGRADLTVRNTGHGPHDAMHEDPGLADKQDGSDALRGGSGIGLPLVQHLASQMGAQFEISGSSETETIARVSFGQFTRASR